MHVNLSKNGYLGCFRGYERLILRGLYRKVAIMTGLTIEAPLFPHKHTHKKSKAKSVDAAKG